MLSHVVWTYANGTKLSLLERDRILNWRWLSGTEIDAAQQLLKVQFGHLRGLEPTYLFDIRKTPFTSRTERLQYLRNAATASPSSVAYGGRRSQALHVNGNHWIAVSNEHSEKEDIVYVYDTRRPHPDQDFDHLVAAVFRFQRRSSFTVVWLKIMPQKDSSSCGPHTIANLTAIAFQRRPDLIQFSHNVCEYIFYFPRLTDSFLEYSLPLSGLFWKGRDVDVPYGQRTPWRKNEGRGNCAAARSQNHMHLPHAAGSQWGNCRLQQQCLQREIFPQVMRARNYGPRALGVRWLFIKQQKVLNTVVLQSKTCTETKSMCSRMRTLTGRLVLSH